MTMRMSADGRAKLIKREGFKTKAYRDSKGIWTIGVGHTAAAGAPQVSPGLVITEAQVDEILSRDLAQYEDAVNAVGTPLTQGQFDALVSFCFNVGGAAFRKSTVAKKLAQRDHRGAADAMLMWNKPPEIIGRRRSERAQFLAASATPIADAARARFAAIDLTLNVAPEPLPTQAVVADLRAAGSRTIAGADQMRQGLAGVGTALATATAIAVQIPDLSAQAHGLATSLQTAASSLEWARDHAGLAAISIAFAVAAWFAAHAWRGASLVTAARVDDALSGLNIGR